LYDRFSEVSEIFHPFRPILWADTAGFGPEAICVEITMPIQFPQFLGFNLPNREIQKNAICPAVMMGKIATAAILYRFFLDLMWLICYKLVDRTSEICGF